MGQLICWFVTNQINKDQAPAFAKSRNNRNNRLQMFYGIAILKKLVKLTGKHLQRSTFISKVTGL